MPIRIRHLKNPKRETEVVYATIPLKEIDSPQFSKEFYDVVSNFYDSEKVNQGRTHKGRKLSHAEYASWSGYESEVGSKQNLENPIQKIRDFVKSEKKEIIFPLWGKEIKAPTGNSTDYDAYRFSLKKIGKNLLIMPQPLVHTLFRVATAENTQQIKELSTQYFEVLQSVLEKGFIAPDRDTDANAVWKRDKTHHVNPFYSNAKRMKREPSIVSKDAYSIELFPDKGHSELGDYTIEKASPKRILAVNIELDKTTSREEMEKKMQFYKKEITEKYQVPVRYLVSTRSDKKSHRRIFPKEQALEQKVSSVVAIAGLVSSFFLLGSSVTGNAIADLPNKTSSFLGLSLLIVGLIAGFFWLKAKK